MHGRNEKVDEAFVLFETALEIRMNLLGIDHLKVGQTLFSLGILLDQKRNFKAAMNSFADSLEILQKTVGHTSLQYAEALAAVGRCLGNQSDFESAIDIWNEVIQIYNQRGYGPDHPEIMALEEQQNLATQFLKKTKKRHRT